MGAFCRVYDVSRGMDKFLPGVYEETDTPGRYTFTGGSTTGGAVLYDGEVPVLPPCHRPLRREAGQRLRPGAAAQALRGWTMRPSLGRCPHQLPSYKAMCELAVADEAVVGLLSDERWGEGSGGVRPRIRTGQRRRWKLAQAADYG